MAELEELKPGASVEGILPDTLMTIVSVQWYGPDALELTYKSATGKVANEVLFRDSESRIKIVEQGHDLPLCNNLKGVEK